MPDERSRPARVLGALRWVARAAVAAVAAIVGRVLLRRIRGRSAPAAPSRPPRAWSSRVASADHAPPLFSRRATTVMLGTVAAVLTLIAGGVAVALLWVRTPYSTAQFATVEQPVPFSHLLHVTGFEIDCRYCHATVERAPTAGMPDTRTCVPCHNPTWYEGPWFEPVRRSIATGQPIQWRRVNDLPDHVFFNHAVHVQRGMPCASCHGNVAQMHVVYQTAPLTMAWCLECHMDPEPWLRPVEGSTVQRTVGAEWPAPHGTPEPLETAVQRLTTCTACHR